MPLCALPVWTLPSLVLYDTWGGGGRVVVVGGWVRRGVYARNFGTKATGVFVMREIKKTKLCKSQGS